MANHYVDKRSIKLPLENLRHEISPKGSIKNGFVEVSEDLTFEQRANTERVPNIETVSRIAKIEKRNKVLSQTLENLVN